jgi:hypothetical protein
MTPRSAAEDPFPTVFLDPLAWIPMETVSNILGHYPGAVGLALLTNGTLIITVGPNTDMEILEFFSPQVICNKRVLFSLGSGVTPTSGRADRENPPDYIECRGPTGSGSRSSCGVVVELQGEQYLAMCTHGYLLPLLKRQRMQEQGRGKGLLAALRGTQEDSPSHVPD